MLLYQELLRDHDIERCFVIKDGTDMWICAIGPKMAQIALFNEDGLTSLKGRDARSFFEVMRMRCLRSRKRNIMNREALQPCYESSMSGITPQNKRGERWARFVDFSH